MTANKKELGLNYSKLESLKESNDSLHYMNVFDSVNNSKDFVPARTPSSIKKKLQTSLDVVIELL